LHVVLDHISKSLANIKKAIGDFEKQKDFERINELEIAKASLEMSQKIIRYGLFHN
jgi:hypothetical protein